jgi:hypothetical protein
LQQLKQSLFKNLPLMLYRKPIVILFYGFLPYVNKKKVAAYKEEFANNAKNSKEFALAFFSKFVRVSYYHKRPKEPEDALLFNYFVIEVPHYGLRQTDTLKKYYKALHLRHKKGQP